MDAKLLELLVCPVSKAPLVYKRDLAELWCTVSQLAYSIDDGIPVLVPDEARKLSPAELQQK
jgi:uncharacterized protein YbaR (Trm112 family)